MSLSAPEPLTVDHQLDQFPLDKRRLIVGSKHVPSKMNGKGLHEPMLSVWKKLSLGTMRLRSVP